MDPDDLKEAWREQASRGRLTVDAARLDEEVRKRRQFDSVLFWRDVREVGVSLVMIPVWIYMGVELSLPWAWYLAVPAFLWIAGYMLADRRIQRRREAGPGEPLRRHVESSLRQVEHQIRLLRNVLWWYLLPLAVPMLAFFGQVSWRVRAIGSWWGSFVFFTIGAAIVVAVFAGVYKVNQVAVRDDLEPRRRELRALLADLDDGPIVDG
jgi:4-hydroxybenzoate polyprenyltransferase